MSGLFTLLIIGMVIYMLFSRGSGMGCCGGHPGHRRDDLPRRDFPTGVNSPEDENIIDLKEGDYQVLSSDDPVAHGAGH